MQRALIFVYLFSAAYSCASQEKSLAHVLLSKNTTAIDEFPQEMKTELGDSMLRTHPLLPLLIKKLSRCRELRGHTDAVLNAEFSREGNRIVSASKDGTIKIWDEAHSECIRTLAGHTDGVGTAHFNSLGDLIVSSSWDTTAKVWSIDSGTLIMNCEGHTQSVETAYFTNKQDALVTISFEEGTTTIWGLQDGAGHRTIEGHAGIAGQTHFARERDLIVSVLKDRTIKIRDYATGESKDINLDLPFISSIHLNYQGDKLVVAYGEKTAQVWCVIKGRCEHTLVGHKSEVWSAEFNRAGDVIVTASDDATAKIWEVATGRCLSTLQGHTKGVTHTEFTRGGDKLLTVSSDCTVKIWGVFSGTCLMTLEGHCGDIRSAHFTQAGDCVVTASEDTLGRVWKVNTFLVLKNFLQSRITLRQAFLLACIYEVVICRALVETYGVNAFVHPEKAVPKDTLKFVVAHYPSLEQDYYSLPEDIKDFVRPFVVERVCIS